jgi:hypothetical protein
MNGEYESVCLNGVQKLGCMSNTNKGKTNIKDHKTKHAYKKKTRAMIEPRMILQKIRILF